MTVTIDRSETQNGGTDTSQYLTFTLQGQEFGIEILRVQEIRNFSQMTPIPNVPESIKGVMNLRGTVVPIIDLRTKFNMPRVEFSKFTVIIIVNVMSKVIGLIVDAVSDVLTLSEDSFNAAPEFGDGVNTKFIHGLARSEERLVTLLNIENLLQFDDSL